MGVARFGNFSYAKPVMNESLASVKIESKHTLASE